MIRFNIDEANEKCDGFFFIIKQQRNILNGRKNVIHKYVSEFELAALIMVIKKSQCFNPSLYFS